MERKINYKSCTISVDKFRCFIDIDVIIQLFILTAAKTILTINFKCPVEKVMVLPVLKKSWGSFLFQIMVKSTNTIH
jgi:hypothetical protein